jgi:hypothetical protein
MLGLSKSTPIASGWIIDSCGAGSKGERAPRLAWAGTSVPCHHLLVRRNLIPSAKGI